MFNAQDITTIPWRTFGYRHPSHVYNNEVDMPHGQQFVSTLDDNNRLFAYAVTAKGTPRLLWLGNALAVFEGKGHAFPTILWKSFRHQWRSRELPGTTLYWLDLPVIRRSAPVLLDQEGGKALFNLHDALRLLRGYDNLQQRKRNRRRA